MKKITELTAELAAPAIAEAGCTLWDVEYVREAGTWYLRVLLDKEGGVDILDCEAVSRKLSDLLDGADPIEGQYTWRSAQPAPSGPSSGRRLPALPGQPRFGKALPKPDGRKEFAGYLKAYDEATGAVTVTVGNQELTFEKKDVALVRLRVEF